MIKQTSYIPHEKLSVTWINNGASFILSLPWVSLEVDVLQKDKGWIKDATDNLRTIPANKNVQKFIRSFKNYPIFYIQPRSLENFNNKNWQSVPQSNIDCSTPLNFISTFGCPLGNSLREDVFPSWRWDWEKIIGKALIPNTDLYDPLSFISYLICYRLEWEGTAWSGQNGLGNSLKALLETDEDKFYQAVGWLTKQSWYITKTFCRAVIPVVPRFKNAEDTLAQFIGDEAGHHKFMEQVFKDLNLKKEDFPVAEATYWMIEALKKASKRSLLAFSAMINLFEAAYYEGDDPISRVLKLSSRPHAAQGFDLHYKINQDHRHCDMPLALATYLPPQPLKHLHITLSLFELTLHFLDEMEKNLKNSMTNY